MCESIKITFSLDEAPQVVEKYIISRCGRFSVFAFNGPLGSGKTTLVKEILGQMGVKATVTSPTFGYVNSYVTEKGQTVHHFDLYRMMSLDQFLMLGFDEYFLDPNAFVFIEWPEAIQPLLSSDDFKAKVCTVSLSYVSSDTRFRVLEVVV